MRVRNLSVYLREQGLLRQGDLSVLRGMRVGIDAVYFFRSLKGICDPLSEVGGSLPPTFLGVVAENIAQLDRLGIQPVFVFEGMQSKSHILLSAQLMTLSVAEGWLVYSRGDLPNAIGKFLQNSLILSEELIQLLIHVLQKNGKDTIRSPYFAAAQLSYFCAEGIIDAIVGPPSLMLFGVPRCIVSVDFPKGCFEWVELKEVLTRLEITHPQLVDVCLLAGTEHCLSFPSHTTFSFAHCVEMIKQGPIAKHLCQLPHRDGLAEYVDGYCVTKALITYPLILDKKGAVRPLQKGVKIPMDYHKIVGSRIPHGIYHLLCQGVIGPKIPSALATGEWVDDFTLTDSLELRELLHDVREYKCRALGLAVFKLDPAYQGRQIRFQGHVSFMKGYPPIKHNAIGVIPNTCSTRMLSQQAMAEFHSELIEQKKDVVDAEFVLAWHLRLSADMIKEVTPHMAADAISGMFNVPEGAQKPSDQNIFLGNMWCILLDNLGYFSRLGRVTAFGKVLARSKLGLTGLLFMEMLKFGLFTGEEFELPMDVAVSREVVTKSRGSLSKDVFETINLICRIACLHPATVDNSHWRGEVDYLIANYVCHIKVLKRSVNYLLEGTLIMMGGLIKDVEAPYMYENNCFMAIMIKWMLTQVHEQMDGPLNSGLLEAAQNKFPNVIDVKRNLQKFAAFWSAVSKILHELKEYAHIETLGTFDRATKMLQSTFGNYGIIF